MYYIKLSDGYIIEADVVEGRSMREVDGRLLTSLNIERVDIAAPETKELEYTEHLLSSDLSSIVVYSDNEGTQKIVVYKGYSYIRLVTCRVVNNAFLTDHEIVEAEGIAMPEIAALRFECQEEIAAEQEWQKESSYERN